MKNGGNNILFVWIPKAAGMSIYEVLRVHGCPEMLWDRPSCPFTNKGVATFGHVAIQDLISHGTLDEEYMQKAFKFAFIRNPYDRIVSLFFYLRKIGNRLAVSCENFKAFCLMLSSETVPPIGFYNYFMLSQCNPMSKWLYTKQGEQLVDFIGRFETLASDWRAVCEVTGIKQQLRQHNKTEHKFYRDYYCSDSKHAVARFFAEDFDRFKYSF